MEIPAVTIAAPNLMLGVRRFGNAVMRQKLRIPNTVGEDPLH
jgi:hypothetical protein